MDKTALIWWAITGVALSLFVGVVTGLLAGNNGSSIAGSIMTGAAAAGGFAGLWIAGTAAIHTMTS